MIHHIVMWNFKPEITEEEKPELIRKMSKRLCALVDKVPGLVTAVFVERPLSSSTHDIALVTTFKSVDDNAPAKFYVSSCPAHTSYPTVKIDITKARKFLVAA